MKIFNNFAINRSRPQKQLIIFFIDYTILLISVMLSVILRLDSSLLINVIINCKLFIFFGLILVPFFLYVSNVIHILVRSFSEKDIFSIVYYSFLMAMGFGFFNFISDLFIPRSIPIIFFLIFFLLIYLSRYIACKLLIVPNSDNNEIKKIVIFGAGAIGKQLCNSFISNYQFNLIGFVDDNKNLQNMTINNLKIYSRKQFAKLYTSEKIDESWVSIPNLSRSDGKSIFEYLSKVSKRVLMLPKFNEILYKSNIQKNLIEISPEKFIDRDLIDINLNSISENYNNKNIFITGAGGSIGSEVCRQLIKLMPKKIVLFELNEFALYNIYVELLGFENARKIEIIPILGSVLDDNLSKVFNTYSVQCVIHSAAYKHVDLVEKNIFQGFRNNSLGTLNLIKSCRNTKIKDFIFISTDKAVKPTNVMGCTKRIAEILIQSESKKNLDINFSIVRFGNVLGSSGSVLTIFKKQILEGGPITITDLNMLRYFMSIEEAAQLILTAGSIGNTGMIYLLDMGEPIKIYDLALNMIHISGLTIKDNNNPKGDIEIKIINKKDGEKLFEELLVDGNFINTDHKKVFIAKETPNYLNDFDDIYKFEEKHKINMNNNDLISLVKNLEKKNNTF